jgi:hypothetical protein
LPPSSAEYLEILEAFTSWRPKGLSKPVNGLLDFTSLFKAAVSLTEYTASNIKTTTNDELQRVWKEKKNAEFNFCSGV